MTAHTHTGSLLCPSLTRVRALPKHASGPVKSAFHHPAAPVAEPVRYTAADLPKRTSASTSRHRKTDNIEYRLIFAGAFMVFFVAAVFERALPSRWSLPQGNAAIKKPLVEQAKEAASISAGYAFMG